MKKRLLSMILALSMMLTFLPLSVFAGTTNGNYGSGVTWTLTQNNADSNHPTYCLTISSDGIGTGKMTDAYTENGVPWHNVCTQITQVEVTAGVTSIGDHAFYGCSNLATVTLPEGITSIGEEAFRGCEGLTAIRIPSSVQAIGRYAFCECINLATVENLENSKITKIEEGTFSTQYRYPTRLTSIAFPENLSEIGEDAFHGAGLVKITFPEKVTSIGSEAFRNCTKLTTVEGFDNLKLSTVSNHIFGGCEALSSIKIPDTVTTIEIGAFSGCKSLTTIAIPERVTSIGGSAFNDCENLTSVEGFDKLKISSIEQYTFCGCKKLSAITLPDTVKKIDTYAFWQCYALSTITIPENVTSIGFHAFDTCGGLATVVLPQNVPSIGEGAFYGNNENLKIQYPYSKKDWLVQGCTSAKISSLQNDGITILYDSNIIKPIPICYYCSVNFNPNGGTFTDGTTDTKVVSNIYRTENIPEKVQNENKITNPTKSGYTFVGWTLEKDNASTQVDPANISKNITGSCFDGITDDGMTFYALYTVAPKPATVTISGPTDNTVKAGEGSDVFTVAANKGDTDAAKAEFDFAGGKVQYRTGDTGEWLDLTSNELNIDDLTDKQFRVVPDADAVTGQKALTVKLMDASGNEIAGASDSKTFDVTARVHATVKIDGLSGTVETDTEKEFTVTVTANDDAGKNVTAKAGFTGPAGATITLKKVQYRFGDSGEWQDGMQELNGMNLDINSLELPFNSLPNITYKLTVTFAEAGNYEFDVSLTKAAAAEAFTSDSAEVTVTKKKEPVTPGGGSTGGGEKPGENPGGDSGNTNPTPKPDEKPDRKIKIDGGIVEVNGKEVKPDEDGNITVKKGDEITITVDKSKISDAQVFDQWVIKPDSVLNEVDPKSEKISFTMPAEDVTIEAMTRDASIEDDGPGILGTGALIATGVVGSAALLYQGHMLGTELYLRYLLPHGAVIPQNRAELAVLLWQDAENPEPVSTTLYSDISDEDSAIQQAARWAVENDLMEQLDADEHPDHFDPFVPVTFSDSIRAWKKAQELKKSVH